MVVSGLNHVTLAVTDLDRSIAFYRDLLGFTLRAKWREGAYLEAGTLWLCLSLQDQPISDRSSDYSHIGLSVDEAIFHDCETKLRQHASIWKENRSEGKSLYFLDPDGHRLEIHVGDLQSRIEHYRQLGKSNITIY